MNSARNLSSPCNSRVALLKRDTTPSRVGSNRVVSVSSLVTARTAPTPTTNALNRLLLFQLRLGHAADAGGIEVCLFGLDAAETAELDEGSG